MVQHEVNAIAPGSPIAGLMMVAFGVAGWFYSTIVKAVGATVVTLAATGPPPVMAQVTVPGTHMSWADLGQIVSGGTTIAGIVLAWYLVSKNKVAAARVARDVLEAEAVREQRRLDAEEVREQRRLDAQQASEQRLHEAIERLQIHAAETQATVSQVQGHLGRQDVAIQQVAEAVATPPPVTLTVSGAAPATEPTK